MNENGHYGKRMTGKVPPCASCGKTAGVRRWAWAGKWYCRGCAKRDGHLGHPHEFQHEHVLAALAQNTSTNPHDDEIRTLHETSMRLSADALSALQSAVKSLQMGETAAVLHFMEAALATLRERDVTLNAVRALTVIQAPPADEEAV